MPLIVRDWALTFYDMSSIIIYSDVSNVAAAACTVEIERKNFHKMWTTDETLECSTWRELKAIELALCSFHHVFSGKSLYWYTDKTQSDMWHGPSTMLIVL